MCKISVIVPVYNVEQYLTRCVDSILNQTFTDFECILVDDGSTDSSLKICNKYANIDSRVCVIQQNNRGVSSARNIGLERACGEYVVFIDSDDYIESFYLQSIYDISTEFPYDIIAYNNNKVFKTGKIPSMRSCTNEIVKDISKADDNVICKIITSYVWAKAFRREIIINNNMRFDESLQIVEDSIFFYQFLKESNSFYVSKEIPYNYNKTEVGTLSTKYVKNIEVALGRLADTYDQLIEKDCRFKKIFISTARYEVIFNTFYNNIKMGKYSFIGYYKDSKNFLKMYKRFVGNDYIEGNKYGKTLTPILRLHNPLILSLFFMIVNIDKVL